MKSIYLKIIPLLLFTISAAAQNKLVLDGTVLDTERKPVEFATLHLVSAIDSTLISSTTTDISGKYKFENISDGSFTIKVSCFNYFRQSKPITIKSPLSGDFNFILTPSSTQLKNVTISARKPLIEAKSDKLIFNISNTVLADGYDAIEILEKAPGIYVNPQSQSISLNGKQGTTIMVDGKKTYLSASDLATLLKSFSSNTIDKIEIITNPGAKYDAQGGGGVINIITKQVKINGTTGSINLSGAVGVSKRVSSGFNLNHKSGNWVFYGAYNYSHRNSRSAEELELAYLNPLDASITNIHKSSTRSPYYSGSHSYRAGIDYNPSAKTQWAALFTGFNYRKSLDVTSNTAILQPSLILDSSMNNSTATKNINHQYAGNLSFKHTIDSTRLISAEFNYSTYKSNERNNILNTYFLPGNNTTVDGLSLRSHLPATINIIVAKTDYEQPFLKGKIETGLKFSNVNTNNNAGYTILENNQWINDITRSNLFKYKESIGAAYFIYNNSIAGITYKAGLRGELTNSEGNLVTTNQQSDRTYFDLFPSLALTKIFNQDNSLTFAYARRINRPSYQDLNPFIYFIDIYTSSKGNPFLKPEYINNFDLTYTIKSNYVIAAGYSKTSDVISYVTEREDSDSRITSINSQNLNQLHQFYINITAPVKPAKWWTIYNNVNVSHLNYEKNQANPINNSGFYGVYGISNYFFLAHKWQPQLSGYFQTSRPNGVSTYSAQYQVNLGLQKTFSNGLIVRGTYNDIFQSARAISNTSLPSLRSHNEYRWDSNFFLISISFPFGKKKIKTSNTNSAGDEQNRIKS